MTTTINKIIIAAAVIALAFGALSYVTGTQLFVQNAQAATTCASCGGGTPTPPSPPEPPSNPPSNPPTCKIDASLSVAQDGDSFTVSWHGTPSSANFKINGASVVADDSATYHFDGKYDYMRFTMYGENSDGDCGDEVIVYKKTPGCTDPNATNYNEHATEDNGSCTYKKVASCDSFTASPTSLPSSGGDVTLNWKTTNATNVSINKGIGSVDADGNTTVGVTKDTTFKLTAIGADGSKDICTAPVTLESDHQETFSCDSFKSNKSKVEEGENFTLSWKTTNADSVSIDNGIGNVADDGTYDTSTNKNRTYTLTLTKGNETKQCTASVRVKDIPSNPPHHGGHTNPSCDLRASAKKIDAGEEVKLRWNSTGAADVTLKDDDGNVLMTTKDLLSTDKRDLYSGDMIVKPIKDTAYTFHVERGRDDDICRVYVTVGGGVTVLQSRSQQPLVAGISLTQVPYTGFDAGPTLTILFYLLLTLWALFIAYILVIRRDSILGFSLAGVFGNAKYHDESVDAKSSETVSKAEAYVRSVMTDNTPNVANDIPADLPVAETSITGYAAFNAVQTARTEDDEVLAPQDETLNTLENHAHEQRVLLSSDAMRFFTGVNVDEEEQISKLDAVIAKAKESFPSEDGWVVLNLARMESLIVDEQKETPSSVEFTIPTQPMTAGSLAEAILAGNVVAAYEMIAHRPMVALADAAADLDAVYRTRKGEQSTASDLLQSQAAKLSEEQLEKAITALTGALDGTYTDEASAVKMAILKAVKAVA